MKPALIAALTTLLLPAQAAAAPALAPLKPCYVFAQIDETTGNTDSEAVPVSGTGFTPNAEIGLLIDGNTAGRAIATAEGAIAATLKAPIQEKGQREFTVTATDPSQGAVNAVSLVTALNVSVTPRKARPGQKVTMTGRGFTASAPVYAHYTYRGRDRKTVRLATPSGPCGTFKVRRRQFPIARPRTGLWMLRIDQDRRYRARPRTGFFELEVFVSRVPRTRRRG